MKFLSNENNDNNPELIGEFINKDKIVKFNSTKYKIKEFTRALPYLFVGSIILGLIFEYFGLDKEIRYIIMFVFGYLLIDILQIILNHKIDRRIKDMITE